MISTRSVELVIDTVVCLTLAKWETVSGQFGGYLTASAVPLSFISRIARAQTYPARPVRVIVPYAPGGPTDVFGRLMAQKLSEQLGKQFYVENMGGGGNVFPVPV